MSDKYTAIIVEPRAHPALEFVLCNFMENLDERWNFILFHGTENESFIHGIINESLDLHRHRITLINLGVPNLSIAEYSLMFYEESFYSHIPTEMFLVFQTDTIILSENREKINEFLEFDYVGAPWIGNAADVGNGGLSLRRKSKMLELLKYKDIHGINTDPYHAYGKYKTEDCFFNGHYVPEVDIRKPTKSKAGEFSIEEIFNEAPFGIHKTWIHLPSDQLNYLTERYPELEKLMSLNRSVYR